MLLLYVSIIFAVPVFGGLCLLALFVQFGMNKPVSVDIVEAEEECELDLDEIVRKVIRSEKRKCLYRTGTVAGYRP